MNLAESAPRGLVESTKAKIDEIAHGYLKDSKNVGLAVGIIRGGEAQILCYGTTDKPYGIPINPNSVFEIGSITKVFTGILLAEAMRRGEVKLEDPVNDYLPERARIPVRGKKPLTLRHLTTHTSGIPRLPDNIDREVFFSENPYSTYTVEQMYEFLHRTPVTPGRQHAYSNLGAGLLGHILGLAAGKDYEALVKERILEPLGMSDTSIALSEDQLLRLALPHDGGKQVSLWDIPTLSGAGALRSTVSDMLKFLQANLQSGVQAVGRSGVQESTAENGIRDAETETEDVRESKIENRKSLSEHGMRNAESEDGDVRKSKIENRKSLAESIQRAQQIETRGNPFQQNLGCWFAMGLFYALVEIGGRLRIGLYGWPALIPGFILVFGLPIYVAFKWPRGFATMGLGWFMDKLAGTPHLMTWHNGGTGGYCSFIGFTRESGCGVVVLSNSTQSVDSVAARILAALHTG